jgi:hypothetical protein
MAWAVNRLLPGGASAGAASDADEPEAASSTLGLRD